MKSMSRTLVIGCGYTGRRLAARLLEQGQAVTGTVTTTRSADLLEELGGRPVLADLDARDVHLPLEGQDRLYYFAPPPGQGTTDPRLARVLDLLRRRDLTPRIVYTGTTGVYGDCLGAWVTESHPPNPSTARAQRRSHAESLLWEWSTAAGGEVIILRVAGIYGPGRLPLERLKAGLPLVRAEEAPFTNRIHVDDLVTCCVTAMERGLSGQIYNVADGQPSTMTHGYNLLADLLGLGHPPTVSWEEAKKTMPTGLLSYLRENRRIDNSRLRDELGIELKYPALEKGLTASLAEEQGLLGG